MEMKESMNMNVADCKEKLNNVGTWIGSADNKISIGLGIFSINGLFFGFIFSENFDRLMHLKTMNLGAFISVMIIFSFSLLCFIMGLFSYVIGIVPRLKSAKDYHKKKGKMPDDDYLNFWFFKHIASFPTSEKFIEECKCKFGNFDDECRQILEEVYANSNICLSKMRCFKIGIIVSFISVSLSLISVLTLIISSVSI